MWYHLCLLESMRLLPLNKKTTLMHKNNLSKCAAALMTLALVLSSATASTITYAVNNSTPFQTPAVSVWDTTGADMAGMDVWVSFSNGSVEHATWATTAAGAGGASVAGFFSLTESGTTFNVNAWTIVNLSPSLAVTGFILNGAPGDTVFDRTLGNVFGTTDSALGKDFNMSGSYNITATYSDILNLTGLSPVGDEFVRLSVAFASTTLLRANTSATFTQDTDNAKTHGSITPVPEVASTATLLALGIGAIAAMRRRAQSVS
jgi:hypothetical protein